MPVASDSTNANLLLCARTTADHAGDLAHWRARYQAAVLESPGALSFQFWPAAPPDEHNEVHVLRFETPAALQAWQRSPQHRDLIGAAAPFVEGGVIVELAGQQVADYFGQASTSEVIVTQIKAGQEANYRAFAEKIQRAQEAFPGYLGSFVQPPHQKEPGWTAVLRFDSPDHLEAWMNSPERAALLAESSSMIEGFQAQRIDTSFPGWSPVDPVTGKSPNKWKTASLVLLTLYPVVMVEIHFLYPIMTGLPGPLATLFGNSVSVTLTTWPLMPLAIKAFHNWLFPPPDKRWIEFAGPAIVLACYAIEYFIFYYWSLHS